MVHQAHASGDYTPIYMLDVLRNQHYVHGPFSPYCGGGSQVRSHVGKGAESDNRAGLSTLQALPEPHTMDDLLAAIERRARAGSP